MMKFEAMDIETIWINNISYPYVISMSKNGKILSYVTRIENIYEHECLMFMLKNCVSSKIYYVHNLTFESITFLKGLKDLKIKYKLIMSNKIVYQMTIWYKNKKIIFKCSYRLTLLPLAKLAQIASLDDKGVYPYEILNINFENYNMGDLTEKHFKSLQDFEFFKNKHHKNSDLIQILVEYCKNDVFITKNSVIKYWELLESFGIKYKRHFLTAAKISLENFFMSKTIVRKKLDLKLDNIIRKAYFGGRTEVFGNQKKDEIALHFDWSGMYAQCMREKVLAGKIYQSNTFLNFSKPGFYHIEFIQNMEFPILPIKRDKLLFANGCFEGWYWFEEIQLFINNGGEILKVNSAIYGDFYDNFLENFIDKNDKIRELGGLYKQIGKNNNNTFYGRLGMHPLKTSEIITSEKVKNYISMSVINGVKVYKTEQEKAFSNVSISAAITAKARIKLYKGFIEVIKIGGRLLYCDTDSIIAAFHKKNYENMLNKQFGEVFFDINNEDTIIEKSVFALPKTYALKFKSGKEIVKIKGFNSTPNFDEFENAFYNGNEIITFNNQWSRKNMVIDRSLIEKKINIGNLEKRIWSDCKKNTIPLKIESSVK